MNNEEKILKLLELMQSDIKGLNAAQDKTNERLDSMETRLDKMDVRLDRVEQKLDKNTDALLELDKKVSAARADISSINERIDSLEAKNANKHIEIMDKLDLLSRSVDFVKYEDLKTKEEVYSVKKHLNLVR